MVLIKTFFLPSLNQYRFKEYNHMKYTYNTFHNFINQDKITQNSSLTLYEWLIQNIIPSEIHKKDFYNLLKQTKYKKDFILFFHNNNYVLQKKSTSNLHLLHEKDKYPSLYQDYSSEYYIKEIHNALNNDMFTYYEEILLFMSIKYYPECKLPTNINRNIKRILNGISINEKLEITLNVIPEDLLLVYNIIKHNKTNIYTNVKYNTDKINNHEIFLEHIYEGILKQTKQWTME